MILCGCRSGEADSRCGSWLWSECRRCGLNLTAGDGHGCDRLDTEDIGDNASIFGIIWDIVCEHESVETVKLIPSCTAFDAVVCFQRIVRHRTRTEHVASNSSRLPRLSDVRSNGSR